MRHPRLRISKRGIIGVVTARVGVDGRLTSRGAVEVARSQRRDNEEAGSFVTTDGLMHETPSSRLHRVAVSRRAGNASTSSNSSQSRYKHDRRATYLSLRSYAVFTPRFACLRVNECFSNTVGVRGRFWIHRSRARSFHSRSASEIAASVKR